MSECPTVSSPLLQREKPTRLAFDDISGDSKWFEQQSSSTCGEQQSSSCDDVDKLEKFEAKFDSFMQRMDDLAKRHGYT